VIALGTGLTLVSWLLFSLWTSVFGLVVGVIVLDFGIQGALVSNQHLVYALRPEARSRLERGRQVLDGLVKRLGSLKAGDPANPKTSIGPIVSERALEDLLTQIQGAKAAGACIVLGGKRIDRPGFYLEPTIITDIAQDNPLYQQETFGPVLSFYVVDNEEEAINLANATRFGLGSAVFSADVERAKKVAAKIEAGMVFINSIAYSAPEVPFGGVKNSGYGREPSELGIGWPRLVLDFGGNPKRPMWRNEPMSPARIDLHNT
jgi:hypothetical protein